MAKLLADIMSALGISSDTSLSDLLDKATKNEVMLQTEINKIKAMSVIPLQNQVKDKADEIKTRMTDIVLNEDKGIIYFLNARTVLLTEIVKKLDSGKADLSNEEQTIIANILKASTITATSGMITTLYSDLDNEQKALTFDSNGITVNANYILPVYDFEDGDSTKWFDIGAENKRFHDIFATAINLEHIAGKDKHWYITLSGDKLYLLKSVIPGMSNNVVQDIDFGSSDRPLNSVHSKTFIAYGNVMPDVTKSRDIGSSDVVFNSVYASYHKAWMIDRLNPDSNGQLFLASTIKPAEASYRHNGETVDLGTSSNPFDNGYFNNVMVSNAPTVSTSATNKNYVDTQDSSMLSSAKAYADTFGKSLAMDSSTYVISLKDANGNVLSSVDLPLETMVVSASYSNGYITLTLKNGQTLTFSVSDLISGLATTSYVDTQDATTLSNAKSYTDTYVKNYTYSKGETYTSTEVNAMFTGDSTSIDAELEEVWA